MIDNPAPRCRWWQRHRWGPWIDDPSQSDPPICYAQDRHCARCDKVQRRFV